ncbi:MAG: FAD-dependent oxidoreductase [Thermoactinospora sp.]|nr:FAD-dependent oxidoreductase [Thermoactinospora sp.]
MKSVIVVGAGIWGSSLALRLAETGWRVTLVEQHTPGHVRQSSAGETRLLRCAHGQDDWYASLAWRARDGWRALGERVGEPLYLESGMVWFAQHADGWERASSAVLERLGIPHSMLGADEGSRFFPDFSGEGLEFLMWEPHAGVIRARRATQLTARLAVQEGAELVRGRAVPHGDAVAVDGEVLRADRVVWACGAWSAALFPDLPLAVTKQDTVHFAVPPAWNGIPAWVDYSASAYGHGDVDGVGMKTTSDAEGLPYEPETGSRVIDQASLEVASAYLGRRFPSLAGSAPLFTQVCQYALTPDAEWIVHERSPGVWVLGGDSGHGFKHAPALAAYVAAILEGEQQPEKRFGLHERLPARGLRTSGMTA